MPSQKIYSHALLFDTNVFNLITAKGKEEVFRRLFSDLHTRVHPEEVDAFISFATPFLFLEYLGVQPSSFPNIEIPADLLKDGGWKAAVPFVFQKATDHFTALQELTDDSLRQRDRDQLEHVSDAAKAIRRDIISRLTNGNGFSNLIKQQLALDYSYGYNFKKYLNEADLLMVHVNSLLDIFRGFKKGVNISQARGVFEATDHLRQINKNNNAEPKALEAMNGKIGLKLFKDRGDLDILQLITVGAFLNGTHYPVLAFTADPIDSVRSRLEGFKTLVHHLCNNVKGIDREDIKKECEGFELKNGQIAFVDRLTGGITEFLDVGSIPVIA